MTHPEPTDDSLNVRIEDVTESIFNSGHNTVRGNAAYTLPRCYYLKQHENLIFETLEHIAEHDLLSVRCQIMPQLALLTNCDKTRTLRLFLRLVRDSEEVILKHSSWSAQYLARHDFEGMASYFEKCLAHPELHKDMGVILSLAWIFGREDALDLLNQFVEAGDKAQIGAIEVASHNICDDKGKPILKSVELFERFFDTSSEQVIQAYDNAFRNFQISDFPHLNHSLIRFSQTMLASKNPRSFYTYLINCAQGYPAECLGLVENFGQYVQLDTRLGKYQVAEPLKVVLNAYHKLWGKKMKQEDDHATLKKALVLFNRMLLDDRFQDNAESVLDNIEK